MLFHRYLTGFPMPSSNLCQVFLIFLLQIWLLLILFFLPFTLESKRIHQDLTSWSNEHWYLYVNFKSFLFHTELSKLLNLFEAFVIREKRTLINNYKYLKISVLNNPWLKLCWQINKKLCQIKYRMKQSNYCFWSPIKQMYLNLI